MKSPVRKTTALLRTARRQADLPRARHVLLPPTRLRLVGGLVLAGALPPLLSLAIGHTHLGLAGITFLGVVLLSALLARLAGGLVAAVSGALAYLDWFGPPSGELSVTRTTDAIAVAVFVGVALLVSLITGLQQAARAGLERHARALEEAVDGLRALLDGLGAVVWMSDERFRVTFISQSVERILGYTRERWLDEVDFWLAHIHPDDRERVSAETRAHAQAGEDYEHDYRFVAADGRVVWLRNIVSVSRTSRGETILCGIAVDVSEPKRLEELLRQSQKMEAVGQLAGGIAHDFNNLLTVVLGHAALALASPAGRDSGLRGDLEQIERAAERAASLTAQLLAFGRKQLLRPTVLDLNEVVVNVDRLLRRSVGTHLVIRTRTSEEPVRVRADRTQLELVLVNLALNARDAVGEGGELTIEVGSAELGAHEAAEAGVAAGRYALLVVRDDGQGMEATTRTRVFEPFFTTKPTGEGTGLGLSTAHGIVTQTGGAITVESAPGEGATFRILLPRADGDEVPAPPPDPAPGAAGGGTVLVVEDEELVRAVIAEMLESHGYRVLSATGAQEGEALFEEHGCDVLVTDVVMPGESGVDLARRLSARRPGLRILYVSGYAHEAFPGAAALEPGSAFLQKPFTVEALAQALAELLAAPAAAASPAP